MRAASVSDYRELARRRLPQIFFEYIDGGSYAEATLARNVADFEAIALRQRVMRDMSKLDMTIETLGQKLADAGRPGAGRHGRACTPAAARCRRRARPRRPGVPVLPVDGRRLFGGGGAPRRRGALVPALHAEGPRLHARAARRGPRRAGCPVLVFTVDLPMPGVALPRRPLRLHRVERPGGRR